MTRSVNTSFLLLWVSQALSQLGTSVSTLAYPLLVLHLTGSALDAGLVGTVVAATALLVRLPAGVVADRYRYRTLMLAAGGWRLTARAVVVAVVAVTVAVGLACLPLLLLAVTSATNRGTSPEGGVHSAGAVLPYSEKGDRPRSQAPLRASHQRGDIRRAWKRRE